MPNKNYVKGRKKEYLICKRLRDTGWDIVQRSAGSHSPIDIFAIDKESRLIKLIQAKPEGFNSKKIEENFKWLSGKYTVIFEVI